MEEVTVRPVVWMATRGAGAAGRAPIASPSASSRRDEPGDR